MEGDVGLFMKVGEVAEKLRISRAHCYRLIAAGRVPAIRRGRTWLVPCDAWQAWLGRKRDEALRSVEERGPEAEKAR